MDSTITELFEKVKFGNIASAKSTTPYVAKTRKTYTKITKNKVSENDVFSNIRKNEMKNKSFIQSGVKFTKKHSSCLSTNNNNRVAPVNNEVQPVTGNRVFKRKEIVMHKNGLGVKKEVSAKPVVDSDRVKKLEPRKPVPNNQRNVDSNRRQTFGIRFTGSKISRNISYIKKCLFLKSLAAGGMKVANKFLGTNNKNVTIGQISIKSKGFTFGRQSSVGIPKVRPNDAIMGNDQHYGDENKYPLRSDIDELVDMLGLVENKLQSCQLEDLRQICLLEKQTKFLLKRIDETDLV